MPKAQAISLLGEHPAPAPSSTMLRLAWSALPLGLEVDGEGCVSQVTVLLCTLSQGPGAPFHWRVRMLTFPCLMAVKTHL